MLNSARWGSLRPPGSNLTWYYSPNSLGSSAMRSLDTSTVEQPTPFGRLESEKSMGITNANTGVNQRLTRFVSSSAPDGETTPLRVHLSTPDRPGTAPRLRFDDLRGTGERMGNLDSTQSKLDKPGAAAGKKTAFVAAMQVKLRQILSYQNTSQRTFRGGHQVALPCAQQPAQWRPCRKAAICIPSRHFMDVCRHFFSRAHVEAAS
jgi:hypothetical protein